MHKISSKELQDLLEDTNSIEAVNFKEKKQLKKRRTDIYIKQEEGRHDNKIKKNPK